MIKLICLFGVLDYFPVHPTLNRGPKCTDKDSWDFKMPSMSQQSKFNLQRWLATLLPLLLCPALGQRQVNTLGMLCFETSQQKHLAELFGPHDEFTVDNVKGLVP